MELIVVYGQEEAFLRSSNLLGGITYKLARFFVLF